MVLKEFTNSRLASGIDTLRGANSSNTPALSRALKWEELTAPDILFMKSSAEEYGPRAIIALILDGPKPLTVDSGAAILSPTIVNLSAGDLREGGVILSPSIPT